MRIRAALVALPLFILAACGSHSSAATTTGSTGSAASGSDASASGSDASASGSVSPAATLGPEVPAATDVAAAVPADQMPTATGGFGTKPTLTFPKTPAPSSLQRQILVQGTGATAAKGDFLVTNYLGQIWGGKVFDNSYDKKTTATFEIGAGKVVPGWDTALVGMKAGSRVLLSLPPADGYGSTGNSQAGISGTDTIVFVIDIVSTIPSGATGQTNATLQKLPADVPQVSGALGQEPKITIGKSLKEPTKNAVYVVAKGTGAAVKAGTVLAQLVVTDWAQSQTQSTWKTPASSASSAASSAAAANAASKGLQSITVSADSAISGLIGLPFGSRVLVMIAPSTDQSSGQASPSAVAVIDLVAQG